MVLEDWTVISCLVISDKLYRMALVLCLPSLLSLLGGIAVTASASTTSLDIPNWIDKGAQVSLLNDRLVKNQEIIGKVNRSSRRFGGFRPGFKRLNQPALFVFDA